MDAGERRRDAHDALNLGRGEVGDAEARVPLRNHRLVRRVGERAGLDVYLAEQTTTGHVSTVLRSRDRSGNPEVFIRLLTDLYAANRAQHPALATTQDVLLSGNDLYVVVDPCDGEPLAERLRRCGRLEEIEAIEIALRVADALESGHRVDVVHGDLSTENVVLVPSQRGDVVRILGFGLTSFLAPARYTADRRADVRAIGALLVEMVTGEPWSPDGGRPALPAAIERIARRCLDSAADDTFPTMVEVAAALAEAAAAAGAPSTIAPRVPYVPTTPAPVPTMAPRTIRPPPGWIVRAWRRLFRRPS